MRDTRFRWIAALPAFIAAAATVAACAASDVTRIGIACAGVGYYALDVTIRDQFGQAQALGTRVTITDGNYTETDSTSDTLHVLGASDRGGRTYDIRVSKPYYTDAVVSGVKTRGGGCVTGSEAASVTLTVPVILTLAAGAPPVRAVRVLPAGPSALDRPPHQSSLAPSVAFDANPDLPRSVTWSIAGDTAAVGFDPGSGTVTYRCGPKSDLMIVTARSTASPAIFGTKVIRLQGHPANNTDPPC